MRSSAWTWSPRRYVSAAISGPQARLQHTAHGGICRRLLTEARPVRRRRHRVGTSLLFEPGRVQDLHGPVGRVFHHHQIGIVLQSSLRTPEAAHPYAIRIQAHLVVTEPEEPPAEAAIPIHLRQGQGEHPLTVVEALDTVSLV